MAGSTKIRGITIELNADTAGIADGLKQINKSLATTTKNLKDVDKLLKLDPSNIELLSQKQDLLTKAIADTETKLLEEQRLLEQMKGADNASETVEQQKALAREIEATKQKLGGYQDELNNLGNATKDLGTASQEASSDINVFGDVLKANLASEAIVGTVRLLADGIKELAVSSIESGMAFESSMSKVEALSGATGDQLAQLSDRAKELGASTIYSASQVADAFGYMSLAGWNTEQMLAGIEPVLNLAASADMDLAQASDIVTDYITAFGLSAEDAAKFADQMAYAMANSNTNVEQLGEAYKNCAATAGSMGYSVEEVTAALSVMANAGIKGGEAGTALNAIMIRLATNTKECADALADYGVDVYDSQGNLRSLSDILQETSVVFGTLTDQQQASLSKMIAGTSHYSAFQSIMAGVNASVEDGAMGFADYQQALESCNGSAEQMADTMQNNLKGKVTALQSAFEGLQLSLYDIFDDSLKNSVTSATTSIQRLNDAVKNGNLGVSLQKMGDAIADLVDKTLRFAEDALPGIIDFCTVIIENAPEVISAIVGIVTAQKGLAIYESIMAMVASYQAFTTATEGATVAQWLLNAAMDANPVGIIITAVGALTGALVAYAMTAETTAEQWQREADTITQGYKSITNATEEFASKNDEFISSLSSEKGYISSLVDELDSLNSAESLSVEDKQRMSEIIGILNTKFEGLGLTIDSETGRLADNTNAWKDNINAQLNAAQVAAVQDELTEAYRRQAEEEQNKYNIEQDIAELEAEHGDQLKELISLYDEGTEANAENYARMCELEEELGVIVPEYNNLNQALADSEQACTDAGTAIDRINGYLETECGMTIDANGNIVELTSSTDELATSQDTAAESVRSLTDVLMELDDEYLENKQKCIESLEGQREAFEKLDEQATVSVQDIATQMETQAENMQRWAQDIADAEAIMEVQPGAEGLLNYYIEQGPEAAAELEALVEAFNAGGESAETFREACEAFNETEVLIDGLADLNEAISTGSTEAIQMALESLETELPAMEEAFATSWEAQETAVEEYRTTMTETTTGTVTDMATAINENAPLVTEATTQMMEDTIQSAKTALGMGEEGRSQQFFDLGKNVDQSVADGMIDNQSVIAEALKTVFDNALNSYDFSGFASKVNSALGEALGG